MRMRTHFTLSPWVCPFFFFSLCYFCVFFLFCAACLRSFFIVTFFFFFFFYLLFLRVLLCLVFDVSSTLGTVKVEIKDPPDGAQNKVTLKAGDCFGEEALVDPIIKRYVLRYRREYKQARQRKEKWSKGKKGRRFARYRESEGRRTKKREKKRRARYRERTTSMTRNYCSAHYCILHSAPFLSTTEPRLSHVWPIALSCTFLMTVSKNSLKLSP